MSESRYLNNKQREFDTLDIFSKPGCLHEVRMESDEVTAVCPVTEQPDYYTVTIDYQPNDYCIESKSLKLYLQTFRNRGIFCEAFASVVAEEVWDATAPKWVRVDVTQKPRGGVEITAQAELGEYDIGEE